MQKNKTIQIFIASSIIFFTSIVSAQINNNPIILNNGQVSVSDHAFALVSQAHSKNINTKLSLRRTSLMSYGLRVGQQYGYAEQLQYLQRIIKQKSFSLNKIFNFAFLLSYANKNSLAINILPPVLLKSNNFIEDNSGQSITISNEHYSLYRQAKLITTIPSWQDYLIQAISKPQKLSQAYLPHNSNEQEIWKMALEQGWKLGIRQANQEMTYRINLLSRDFNGMVTYLILLAKHKVVAPYIAYSHQSVIGDSQSMSVNQDIYRITAKAKLVTNPNYWKFKEQKDIQ